VRNRGARGARLRGPEPGCRRCRGTRALVSAGTGLGEAALWWDGITHRPAASEGGSSSFAPRSPLEVALYRFLAAEQGQRSPSVGRFDSYVTPSTKRLHIRTLGGERRLHPGDSRKLVQVWYRFFRTVLDTGWCCRPRRSPRPRSPVCHAGGRGFESRRSRLETRWKRRVCPLRRLHRSPSDRPYSVHQ
jgi:hypothetical protein